MANDSSFGPHLNAVDLAFRYAPIGLLVSRDRVIDLYNEAFSAIFCYSMTELVGQSLQCLYPSSNEFERIGDRATKSMRATGNYSDERIMRHKNGSLFWCHVTGRSFDAANPHAAATWVFEDISETRQVSADLTARERQIAQLLVLGKSSKLIAKELSISPRTVEAHRSRLMRKLNAATAGQLVARLMGQS
jgi:PAS domain S-box-containing protein